MTNPIIRYVQVNGKNLLSQDRNMVYSVLRKRFDLSTLQVDMLLNLYRKGTLEKEGEKVIRMWDRAAGYQGNTDGQDIYPREIDHGYEEPISGGSGVMQQLVQDLRREQGRTASQNVVLAFLSER